MKDHWLDGMIEWWYATNVFDDNPEPKVMLQPEEILVEIEYTEDEDE